MKIKLPKDMRGVSFPRVLNLELNDFDIDLFLPALFFTILSQGKGKARQTNNPQDIQKYIDSLIKHPMLKGFDTAEGRRVLERFARTSLMVTGRVGRAQKGEQILSLVPYTILTHKAGFPEHSSRQRRVDVFIYQALRDYLQSDNNLRDFVKQVFGRGVEIGQLPELGGKYDGQTQLDILTRISVAFLDGFENTRPRLDRERKIPNVYPALVNELAKDLLRYLFEFHDRMPTQAFTQTLLALTSFEVFSYTLCAVHATNALVREPDTLPSAMQEEIQRFSPHIYLDFTNGTSPRSLEMSKACVRRDIEAYQQFLWSNLLLRQLDIYVNKLQKNPRRKADIEKVLPSEAIGAQYLQGLLLLQDNPIISVHLEAAAQLDEERIHEENREKEEEGNTETTSWIDEIASTGETDIERIVNILTESQRVNAFKNFIAWFHGIGGIKKPYGILRGLTTHRQTWRYAPENDLLAALVQVAAARLSQPGQLRDIKLQEFLEFLTFRYGILIDRPPAQFQGAEYAAAARDNLRAMLDRLRQMGIFRDLSDDFTVQRLHPPYASTAAMKVEA
ncbi:methylation-associated defense system protein MAD7 [Ktedonobacter racemifer]|uniref:Uncharacterized protein n=1 Tax=Ktedonobacter racemifer DSM 44963 TaxID=485913 RepID=D6U8L2_KTERA|nr:hypothetical protein [Ktedonobacter racemifer]EFH80223.1 conserved hypothetical protein [Ktedonobacter racemifer DSM 44963]